MSRILSTFSCVETNGGELLAAIARRLSKGTVMTTARYHKTKIGEHDLRPETLMLGYGYDP
ncbi:MAG: hypothetical protein ACREDV_13500, partial [Methylocella sp.]